MSWRLMKKKYLILIVLVNVLVFFSSYLLKTLFADQSVAFNFTCMSNFFAVILIFEYKNALKPTKGINTTKKYYEKRGELDKYKNICKFFFLAAFIAGILSFLRGVFVIVVNYIKVI